MSGTTAVCQNCGGECPTAYKWCKKCFDGVRAAEKRGDPYWCINCQRNTAREDMACMECGQRP